MNLPCVHVGELSVATVILVSAVLPWSAGAQTSWEPTSGIGGWGPEQIVSSSDGTFYCITYADLFRSTDNGSTWELRNFKTPLQGAGLILCPSGNIIATTGSDILRSSDKGATWISLGNALPAGTTFTGTMCRNGTLLAVHASGDTIWQSRDDGSTWSKVEAPAVAHTWFPLFGTRSGFVFARIDSLLLRTHEDSLDHPRWVTIDTAASDISSIRSGSWGELYALTTWTIKSSADTGAHWGVIYRSDLPINLFHVSAVGDLYAGWRLSGFLISPRTIFDRSTNYGATWQSVLNSEISKDMRFSSLSSAPNGTLILGSPRDGLFRSGNKGQSWTQLTFGWGPRVNALSHNPLGSSFAATEVGVMVSHNSGRSWTPVNPGVVSPPHKALAIGKDGTIYASYADIQISSGRHGVVRSTDDGATWSWAEAGLNNTPIASLAVGPLGQVFAGTGGGNPETAGLYRSTDRGNSWQRVLPLEAFESILALAVTPSGTTLASTSRPGRIYHSTTNGDSWAQVIPGDGTKAVIQLIADSRNILYAALGPGEIWRSTNSGGIWEPLNTGLGDATVTVLAVDSLGSVYAGTLAHGVLQMKRNSSAWVSISTGLPVREVSALTVLPDGSLLAGVGSNGVFRLAFAPNDIPSELSAPPSEFILAQNYPNPFNPSTMIRYGLPQRSHVTVTVFNILGQQIAQLVNGEMNAGYHEVRFDGRSLASGVYLYRMVTNRHVDVKKLLLVR